jgi:hypothetical protein
MPRPKIKITLETCKDLAKQRGIVCLSEEYTGNKAIMTWKCGSEHTWNACFASLKDMNSGCPHCAGKRACLDDCIKSASGKDGYCLSTEYENNYSLMIWLCKHGHKWSASYNSVSMGSWCSVCSGNKKHTIEFAKELAVHNGGSCTSTEYKNTRGKLQWMCSKGHQFKMTLNHVDLRGQWCPRCNRPGKKSRERICLILKTIYPTALIRVNVRDIGWLRGPGGGKMELDFYIPGLSLAIEYDGAQHFTPTSFGRHNEMPEDKMIKFQSIKQRDALKDKLMSEHREEINHFIRIPYTTKLTEENIRNILQQKGII